MRSLDLSLSIMIAHRQSEHAKTISYDAFNCLIRQIRAAQSLQAIGVLTSQWCGSGSAFRVARAGAGAGCWGWCWIGVFLVHSGAGAGLAFSGSVLVQVLAPSRRTTKAINHYTL